MHNYIAQVNNNYAILTAPVGKLEASLQNEWSTGYRPALRFQSETEGDLQTMVSQELAQELQNIPLTINMKGWDLSNKIPRPGQYITVVSPRCYLFNKTKFIIRGVTLNGDESKATCDLDCVVPEVFNGKAPKNIFIDQGNNSNFKAGPDNPPPLKQQNLDHL
jgi:hypothetical protein